MYARVKSLLLIYHAIAIVNSTANSFKIVGLNAKKFIRVYDCFFEFDLIKLIRSGSRKNDLTVKIPVLSKEKKRFSNFSSWLSPNHMVVHVCYIYVHTGCMNAFVAPSSIFTTHSCRQAFASSLSAELYTPRRNSSIHKSWIKVRNILNLLLNDDMISIKPFLNT